MTPQEACDRIAALCDDAKAGTFDTIYVRAVRAVLAEVTLEAPPAGVHRVQRNGDFQTVFFDDGSQVYGSSESTADGDWIDSRGIENVLRLAAGVTLTPEEAALAAAALRLYDVRDATVNALAARLEAAS